MRVKLTIPSYLCWQRAVDIRTLKEAQIDGDYMRFQPSKTIKTSGRTVDIFITPQIRDVIDRAKAIKKKNKTISPYLFPTRNNLPYSGQGLSSMWDRALHRAKITDNIVFKDLRALGATDAAKAGEKMADIQTRLAHTSSKTSEIYIKESVPDTSNMSSKLPW
jgi:integrase